MSHQRGEQKTGLVWSSFSLLCMQKPRTTTKRAEPCRTAETHREALKYRFPRHAWISFHEIWFIQKCWSLRRRVWRDIFRRDRTGHMILFCWLVIESELFYLRLQSQVILLWPFFELCPLKASNSRLIKGHLWVISLWWPPYFMGREWRGRKIKTGASCKAAKDSIVSFFLHTNCALQTPLSY